MSDQLVILIICVLGVLNWGLVMYLIRVKKMKNKKVFFIGALTLALSYSAFLNFSIPGFPILYTIIFFLVAFIGGIVYPNSLMGLHNLLFRKRNK